MNIGGLQPQIWFSIFVLVAAVGIGVVATLLKRKNDRLREILLELQSRREDEKRRLSNERVATAARLTALEKPLVAPAPSAEPDMTVLGAQPNIVQPETSNAEIATDEAPMAEIAVEDAPVSKLIETDNPENAIETSEARGTEVRDRNLAIRRAEERAIEFTARPRRRRSGPPREIPKLDEINAKEALSDWLNKRAAARVVEKPASPVIAEAGAISQRVEAPVETEAPMETIIPAAHEPEPEVEPVVAGLDTTPVASNTEPDPEVESLVAPLDTAPVASNTEPETQAPAIHTAPVATEPEQPEQAEVSEPEITEPQPAIVASSRPAVYIDESLWESILGRPPVPSQSQTPLHAAVTRLEIVQPAPVSIPAGLHDEGVLTRLIDADLPFTGLVISIAVSQNDERSVSHDMLLHVQQLVRSILREDEFACRKGADEFLLLSPGQKGTAAKRRSSHITERLWDFQLRGAGNFCVTFNSAEVQVENRPLGEAVATSAARLHQTRRARKSAAMDAPSAHKFSAAV